MHVFVVTKKALKHKADMLFKAAVAPDFIVDFVHTRRGMYGAAAGHGVPGGWGDGFALFVAEEELTCVEYHDARFLLFFRCAVCCSGGGGAILNFLDYAKGRAAGQAAGAREDAIGEDGEVFAGAVDYHDDMFLLKEEREGCDVDGEEGRWFWWYFGGKGREVEGWKACVVSLV